MSRRRDKCGRGEECLTPYPLVEDVLFTVLSLIVVVVIGLVAISPVQPRIHFAVTTVSTPGANPSFFVVYGWLVDESGVPITGATVMLYDSTGDLVGSATTDSSGFYSMRVRESTNTAYTLTVSGTYNGQPVTGSTTLEAVGDFNYGVSGTVSETEPLVWVALPIY